MDNSVLQKILDSNHHAFAVVGDIGQTIALLQKSLPKNTPDVWCEFFSDFTVEDGHRAKAWQATKPLTVGFKYAVWGITSANTEAQNTLLKILEEPGSAVKIIIAIPHEGILLPTLLSRLMVVKMNMSDEYGLYKKLAEQFIASEPAQRLVLIEENFDYKEDGIKTKFIQFLSECERAVQQAPQVNALEIIKAKKSLSDRSAVPRMVMEHLSMVL